MNGAESLVATALAAGIDLEIAGAAARWVELPPRRGGKGAVA